MGMMSNQVPQGENPTLSHGKYSGMVMVQGQPVEVKGGIAEAEGQKFIVSDDGKMVVDSKGQLIGHIEQGQFVVVDASYMQKMVDAGYVR